MVYNDKIYLSYEGYEDRYGNTIRPALVRYAKSTYDHYICTVFIDGKSEQSLLRGDPEFHGKPYSIALLKPFYSPDNKLKEYNLVVTRFRSNLESDWGYLFSESYALHTMKDPLAYGLLAIALDKFSWENNVLKAALESFNNSEIVNVMFDMINYIAWSLSPSKIERIKELNVFFGKECHAIFPPAIRTAADILKINIERSNLYGTLDLICNPDRRFEVPPTGFLGLLNWLNDDNALISSQDLTDYFPYLSVEKRSLVIKRFFWDVKNGVAKYNEDLFNIFENSQYEYYSRLRYIYESWPLENNVSTEFLFDCLKTYKKTNEKSFQVTNGVLDWVMQKSIQLRRPIDLKFYEWLCSCDGGVVLNKQFKGFAEFECQYELDDYAFEGDSFLNNVRAIRDTYAERLSHKVEQVIIDKETGEPIMDPKTGTPKTQTVTIWEDRWEVLPLSSERIELENDLANTRECLAEENQKFRRDRKLINELLEDIDNLESLIVEHDNEKEEHKKFLMFVNWDKCPDDLSDNYVFTADMVDEGILRTNVEQYLLNEYGTLSPYISERKADPIVNMFMYRTRMRATDNTDAQLGALPGVEESVVKERVKNRLFELFGDTLETDYDPRILQIAQTDTQYRYNGESNRCFTNQEKYYIGRRKIYCAPYLSDMPQLLTGRKCAICRGDLCFLTCIKTDPHWKKYGLIHILQIMGYTVIDDTEAGYIPNQAYNQFVNQINKAIKFSKRLVCRECGHILFPAQTKGHNRYKCLSPNCKEYNKEVYLNYCHKCKKGLIDSRDTKQCPNGLYICPDCNSCCSNEFFESMADRYRRQGITIPAFLSTKIGTGHEDLGKVFCAKCGAEKSRVKTAVGIYEIRCPNCEPIPTEGPSAQHMNEDGIK